VRLSFGSILYVIPYISLMEIDIFLKNCWFCSASLRFRNIYTHKLHMESDQCLLCIMIRYFHDTALFIFAPVWDVPMSGMCLHLGYVHVGVCPCLGCACDWDVSMFGFYLGMGPCLGCAPVWGCAHFWDVPSSGIHV
jgi:hypothetical protein